MDKKITAVSLFSGAGGLDMGFANKGFDIVWANDFDKDSCETHRAWSKTEVCCGDISKISAHDIPDSDIILGGFPCQGFSLSGTRRANDPRNRLYMEYVRIVREKQPFLFVGENVNGLLSMNNGTAITQIINDFSDCGYSVFYKEINASDYGVPEDRKRIFIIGIRKDLPASDFSYPSPVFKKLTLKDVLYHLPAPDPSDVCSAPYSSRYMSRNRKRNWDDVSFTIPAMAKQVPLHPSSPDMVKISTDQWQFGEGKTRRFSYRECAVIQTFPYEMVFFGNLASKYRQIGNAVPVKLAEQIAKSVRTFLINGGVNVQSS